MADVYKQSFKQNYIRNFIFRAEIGFFADSNCKRGRNEVQ